MLLINKPHVNLAILALEGNQRILDKKKKIEIVTLNLKNRIVIRFSLDLHSTALFLGTNTVIIELVSPLPIIKESPSNKRSSYRTKFKISASSL